MTTTALKFVKERAGLYFATTERGTYAVVYESAVYGWLVQYPDGEYSEVAGSMAEAKAWAAEDFERRA